jgi:hypothetical protein
MTTTRRTYAQQKAALTKALARCKATPGEAARQALSREINKTVEEWNAPGSYWPDDWSRWQRAADQWVTGIVL